MTANTYLSAQDRLPLTCTRAGTCCHGKVVWLNPWEVARLAAERGMTPADFRERFTEHGGIRLRFDGPRGWRDLRACGLYDEKRGCSAHAARPLACRFYPLARERRGSQIRYLHEGRDFPCLAGCPDVVKSPSLSIAEYLAGQDVDDGIAAQDAYVELAHDLGDGALILLLDSGLSRTGERETLPRWRALVADEAARLREIPPHWLDLLTIPSLSAPIAPPSTFVAAHAESLQRTAQERLSAPADATACRANACLMFALALHLGQATGIAADQLGNEWIATAQSHGAQG